jgi:Protein of unknown function (DUF3053)
MTMAAFDFSRRAILTFAALSVAIVLAACGPGEATQAKAFQDFLQARILDKKGVRMPRLSDNDRKSFGRFSADYDIIVAFNDTLTDAMGTKLSDVMRRGNITSVASLIDRKGDIVAARDALSALSKAIVTARQTADAARAKVRQPDGLKPVYDKAYAKLVTQPAETVGGMLPSVEQGLTKSIAFAEFLAANRAKFEINGTMVQTADAKLLAQFNEHVEGMRASAGAVNDAKRKMHTLIQGG